MKYKDAAYYLPSSVKSFIQSINFAGPSFNPQWEWRLRNFVANHNPDDDISGASLWKLIDILYTKESWGGMKQLYAEYPDLTAMFTKAFFPNIQSEIGWNFLTKLYKNNLNIPVSDD